MRNNDYYFTSYLITMRQPLLTFHVLRFTPHVSLDNTYPINIVHVSIII